MKRLIFLFVLTFINVNSQNLDFKLDDSNRIGFFFDVVEDDIFKGSISDNLKKRLERIVLSNSFGKSVNDRFGVVVKPTINLEDIYQSTPPKYIFEFDLDVIVIDYEEKVKFGSFTFENLKGLNSNRERALMSGIKSFKQTPEFRMFLSRMKESIINFYNDQCELILSKSKTLANNDDFNNAFLTLSSIPSVCTDCYQKSLNLFEVLYKQKLERECQSIVSQANSLIAKEDYKSASSVLSGVLPGISCHSEVLDLIDKIEKYWCGLNLGKARGYFSTRDFEEAGRYLSLIPESSPCSDEAKTLNNQIFSSLSEIDRRDWDFKMKKYNDSQEMVRKEFDFEVNKFDREQNRIDNELKFQQDNFDKIQKNKRKMQEILSKEVINVAKYNSEKKPDVIREYKSFW